LIAAINVALEIFFFEDGFLFVPSGFFYTKENGKSLLNSTY
jgi:hypothetical protein